MSDYTITNGHSDSWVDVEGFARLSYQELYSMVERGAVEEIIDDKNKKISYRKS